MRTKVTLVLIFLNVALFFFIFKFERNWRTEAASKEARRRATDLRRNTRMEPCRRARSPRTRPRWCAGITSLVIASGRLQEGDAGLDGDTVRCCSAQTVNDKLMRLLHFLGAGPSYGNQLMERISYIHTEIKSPVLIEEYIEGREMYVGVIGNDMPEALPVVELDLSKLPDGTPLKGPDDLRKALLRRPEQFVQTFTEGLLTYATGRKLEYYDMPTVRRIVRGAAATVTAEVARIRCRAYAAKPPRTPGPRAGDDC